MSGSRNPEIITGARGPHSERQAQGAASAARRGPASLVVPEGKVVFQAVVAKYRLQLPSLEVQKGKKFIETPRSVTFDNFLSKPLDVKADADIIELVKESSAFGVDIFDVSDLQSQAKHAQVEAVRQQLDTDPEFRAQVSEALRLSAGDDFDLPSHKKTTKGAATTA